MLQPLKRMVPDRLRPSEIWFQSVMRDFHRHGVLHGPFKGMRFNQEQRPYILNCLLGIYEQELHPIFSEVELDIRPRTVIDMGASFGYYAVGLARLLPDARVIAYESDSTRRPNLMANIRANDVGDRVTVRGEATFETLNDDVRTGTPPIIVVCDIDGAEVHVINPAKSPGLNTCSLLVETHGEEVTGVIHRRLSSTHTVQHIPPRVPTMNDVPVRPWYLRFSDPIQFLVERPRDNGWLWARPLCR